MAIVTKCLVESKQAEDTQTTQYIATDARAIIDKFTVTNTTAAAVTFSCNLVEETDTAGDDNLILERSITANSTYTCPELVGQVLEDGDFISTLAGAATSLTIRISGREISA